MAGTTARRSAVPWLYGVAALLLLLVPVVLLGVWVGGAGIGTALLAAVADLVAAVVAAAVATVVLARRGVRRVRSVVLGHPDGRAGRVAEHGAARWALARDRFAALQREYAEVESDPREIAARPALVDVSVPATAHFVEALGHAQGLATPTEPADPRHREQFAVAVDRAVTAWAEARRTAEDLVAARDAAVADGPGRDRAAGRPGAPHGPAPTLAPGTPRVAATGGHDEYAAVADAVRRAAARGARDLRQRLRA